MIINIASKGEHQVYNVGGIERISILESGTAQLGYFAVPLLTFLILNSHIL